MTSRSRSRERSTPPTVDLSDEGRRQWSEGAVKLLLEFADELLCSTSLPDSAAMHHVPRAASFDELRRKLRRKAGIECSNDAVRLKLVALLGKRFTIDGMHGVMAPYGLGCCRARRKRSASSEAADDRAARRARAAAATSGGGTGRRRASSSPTLVPLTSAEATVAVLRTRVAELEALVAQWRQRTQQLEADLQRMSQYASIQADLAARRQQKLDRTKAQLAKAQQQVASREELMSPTRPLASPRASLAASSSPAVVTARLNKGKPDPDSEAVVGAIEGFANKLANAVTGVTRAAAGARRSLARAFGSLLKALSPPRQLELLRGLGEALHQILNDGSGAVAKSFKDADTRYFNMREEVDLLLPTQAGAFLYFIDSVLFGHEGTAFMRWLGNDGSGLGRKGRMAHNIAFSCMALVNQQAWSRAQAAHCAIVYGRTNSRLAVDVFSAVTAAPTRDVMLNYVKESAGDMPGVEARQLSMLVFDNINARSKAKSRTGLSEDSSTAKAKEKDGAPVNVMVAATVVARLLVPFAANGTMPQTASRLSPARIGVKQLYRVEKGYLSRVYEEYHGSKGDDDDNVDPLHENVVELIRVAREAVLDHDRRRRWRQFAVTELSVAASERRDWMPLMAEMVAAVEPTFSASKMDAKGKFDVAFEITNSILSRINKRHLLKDEIRRRKQAIVPRIGAEAEAEDAPRPVAATFSLLEAVDGNPSSELAVLGVLHDEMVRLQRHKRAWGMATCDNAITKIWWLMVNRVVAGKEEDQRVVDVTNFFFVFTGGLHEEQVLVDMLLSATYDLFGSRVAKALLWVKGGGIESLLSGDTIRVKRNRLQVLCEALELLLMQTFVDDLGEQKINGMGEAVFEQHFNDWMGEQRCATFNVVTDLVDAMRSVLLFHEATRVGNIDLLLGARLQLLEYLLASKHMRYAEVVTRELHMLLKLKELKPAVFDVYATFASTHNGTANTGINGMSGDERMETDGVRVARDNAGDMRSSASVQQATVLGRFFNGADGCAGQRAALLDELGVHSTYREREGSTKEMARDVVMAMAALRAGGVERLLHANKHCTRHKCAPSSSGAAQKHLVGLGGAALHWTAGASMSDACAAAVDTWIKAIEGGTVPKRGKTDVLGKLHAK